MCALSPAPELSPSLYHRRLLRGLEPQLSYRGGDVPAWQRRVRAKLRELLGLDLREDAGTSLAMRSLWRRPHRLGSIEKIVFTSQPQADVPAYVCLPRHAQPPYTFFICLQGHTTGMHNSLGVERDDETKPLAGEGDRDFALGCMRRGIAALCLEQRSFGERGERLLPQFMDYLCHQAAMNALMLGKTLLGERVFDINRALDYLQTRGDAAMERVGVMGNSGGGTTAMFAAGLLPRLRFAMPSCCFSTFDDSILAMFHCVCNYVPHLREYVEMGDILALFAPRPVVIVNGAEDGIFPLAAARREYARLKAVYEACGAGGHCHLVVGAGGHRFYAAKAWPVMLKEIGCTY